MASALNGSSGLSPSPFRRHIALCSWARHLTLTVPFFAQVYKWVLANLMLGVALNGLASHPGGSSNKPVRFMLQKPR